jgi:MFS family permease
MMKGFKRGNLFFVIVALFWFSQYIYVPFFSPYLVTLGVSASLIGVIVGMYGFTQIALRIPLSLWGNRTGGHKIIIGGGLLCVMLSCAIPLFTDSWVGYFLVRTLAGAASSTWVSYTAYQLEAGSDGATGRMGYLFAANTGGCCVSQVIGTLCYDHIGMRALFMISVCAVAAALVLLLLTPFRKRKAAEGGPGAVTLRDDLTSVLKNRVFWVCALIELIVQFLIYATVLGFTPVYAQALGAGSLALGLIQIINQLCAVGISLSFGRLGKRRLPERGLLAASFAILAGFCFFSPYCGVAGVVAIQVAAGVGFGIGNVIPVANAGRELTARQQILSMGFFQTIYGVGMSAGPAITGVMIERTGGEFREVFGILALVALAGMALTLAAYRNPRRA